MKKFKDLVANMPPDSQDRIATGSAELNRKIRLDRLREARQITQQQLAQKLGVTQANVSRLESRDDMHLSTLRDFVQAMGGQLEIYATFPDGRFTLQELIEKLEQ